MSPQKHFGGKYLRNVDVEGLVGKFISFPFWHHWQEVKGRRRWQRQKRKSREDNETKVEQVQRGIKCIRVMYEKREKEEIYYKRD